MRPEEPVSRIMTEAVVVIEKDRPLSEAFDCFRQYPIHHLPVVRDGRLVGMLSSADLIKVEYFAPRGAVDRAAFLDGKFRIEQIMQQPVVSRSPSTNVNELVNLIVDSGHHAVTIVDEDGRVLGIVTTADQHAAALRAADAQYLQGYDPNSVAQTLLYLDERRACLEQVLLHADRFLTAGQDERNHALLLKAVFAAKRAEEHAVAASGEASPLH